MVGLLSFNAERRGWIGVMGKGVCEVVWCLGKWEVVEVEVVGVCLGL